MEIQEFTHSSTDGIHNIYVKAFIPDTHPKALIHIIHGISEHIGRYDRFAKEMAERGYLVFGADLLGHGHTADDGVLGFFAEKDGWNTVCNDIKLLSEIMRAQYKRPYILLGHSMGSFLAQTVYYKRLFPIDGLILSGSGTQGLFKLKVGRAYGKSIYKKLKDKKGVDQGLLKLVFGSYNKKVTTMERTGKEWISSEPEEVDAYVNDPMCGFDPSVSLLLDMFDGLIFINTMSNIARAKKTTPVLLLSGAKDPVGDMGKGPLLIQKRLKKVGVKDVKLKMYDGARHEVMHDHPRKQFTEDVDVWIDKRFNK